MKALGIPIARTYINKVPPSICYEHEVNRYEIDSILVEKVLVKLRG